MRMQQTTGANVWTAWSNQIGWAQFYGNLHHNCNGKCHISGHLDSFIKYECNYHGKNTSVWIVRMAFHWNSSPWPASRLQTQVPSWQMRSTPHRVHYENSLCSWTMRILYPSITTFALPTSDIPQKWNNTSCGWNILCKAISSHSFVCQAK